MSLAYFPMYPSDFDADTGHLSMAEDGAYNRLLRLSWRCPDAKMPDDLEWIFRKSRAVTDEDKALIAAIIAEFFTRKGGKVFSARLHKEWVQANKAHEKRVSAGKNGGRAKAMKNKENAPSNAKAMPEQCSSNQNQNQNHISSVSNDTAADAPIDPAKVAFDAGVKVLTAAGKSEASARSIVGKWRGKHGAEAVIAALGRAQREGAVDPVAFCEGVFRQSEKSTVKRRQLPDGRWQSFDPFNGWVTEHV